MSITLLCPAYNEAAALPVLLDRIESAGGLKQVVLVDDGSTDETAELFQTFRGSVPRILLRHKVNRGLGATMATGFSWAVKSLPDDDTLVTMDADDTHDPALIPALCRELAQGADVVVASRFQAGACEHGVSWPRQILTRGASLLLRVVRPVPGIRDYTCGYRAYRMSILQQLVAAYGEDRLVTTTGFECMIEILLKLTSIGASCSEVPLPLHYERKVGRSKMPIGKTIFGCLRVAAMSYPGPKT